MLPTITQFERLLAHSGATRDIAISLLALNELDINVDGLKAACIDEMKKAATALGFELVQRATPAARGGGRMDCEDADHDA